MEHHGWKFGAGAYVCLFVIFIIQDIDLIWYLLFLTPVIAALLDMAFIQRFWSKERRAYRQRHGIQFWGR